MARHRRPPLTRAQARAALRELQHEHAALQKRYNALEADMTVLVGDLEAYRLAEAETAAQARPAPSWAQPDEAVTRPVPLAPPDAAALTERMGLLSSPSGSSGRSQGTTG